MAATKRGHFISVIYIINVNVKRKEQVNMMLFAMTQMIYVIGR